MKYQLDYKPAGSSGFDSTYLFHMDFEAASDGAAISKVQEFRQVPSGPGLGSWRIIQLLRINEDGKTGTPVFLP